MSTRALTKSPPLRVLKTAIKGTLARAKARAVEFALSYSTADLQAKLNELGLKTADSVMLHASFSRFNGYQGGPPHVIDGILDVIGPKGHLFMVSMPYSGSSEEYLRSGVTFRVRNTPSQMGLISECFRRRRGVLRSANPLHPVLAWGPRSEWLVSEHGELSHSCGPGSPFEKMLELDTKALFFGVDLDVLTFTHYLEDLFQATAPVAVYTNELIETSVIDASGAQRPFRGYPFSKDIGPRRDFASLYDAFERAGRVRRDRLGNTRLALLSLRDLLEFSGDYISRGGRIFDPAGAAARAKPSRGFAKIAFEELRSGRAAADIRRSVRRTADVLLRGYRESRLPSAAKEEMARDRAGLGPDPGPDTAISGALQWICLAQDRSASCDGGVARHYSLISGWSPSYPETTGYIIPTLLEHGGSEMLTERARRMLDWLVSIQFAEGGFPGGMIGQIPVRPVTFNTGQILMGLAHGARSFGDAKYSEAMHRAASWLVATQDKDGCWRRNSSPFAYVAEHAYDTHTAWGLLEAARTSQNSAYADAALANMRWALTHQRDNGWFGRCCLNNSSEPLTHTIGYALRGILEGYLFGSDPILLRAAQRTADPLLRCVQADGFLAGRLKSDWSPAVKWSCLTGSVQIAHAWLLLYQITGNGQYFDAARSTTAYVRRTLRMQGAPEIRGVKGSFPVDGDYCQFQYPNWAAKFLIDANRLELSLLQKTSGQSRSA